MSAKSSRPLSPVFWAAFWATLVNRSASFVSVFLALHLTQDFAISSATAGWIVGCWGIGSLVASPISGVLTDRIGRRATMLVGLVGGGFAVIGLALVSELHILFVLAVLGGGLQQLYFPAGNALVADVVPAEDRPRAYGLIYWASNLGLAIGFTVGGIVPDRYLWLLFLVDAGTSFLCAGLIAVRIPETRPAEAHHDPVLAGLVKVVRDGSFLTFAGFHLVALIVFTQFQLALPLDMRQHDHGSRAFAWLMAFNCAGVVVLQPWLAPKLRRFSASNLLAVSAVLFGAGYALNAVVPGLAQLLDGAGGIGGHTWGFVLYLAGALGWTVGEVVGLPTAGALVADLSPIALRGRYQGAMAMIWGMAMSLSPVLGGQIMAAWGGSTLWSLCGALGVLIAVGYLATAPARKRRLAELAAAAAS
jgi:MFS family permease